MESVLVATPSADHFFVVSFQKPHAYPSSGAIPMLISIASSRPLTEAKAPAMPMLTAMGAAAIAPMPFALSIASWANESESQSAVPASYVVMTTTASSEPATAASTSADKTTCTALSPATTVQLPPCCTACESVMASAVTTAAVSFLVALVSVPALEVIWVSSSNSVSATALAFLFLVVVVFVVVVTMPVKGSSVDVVGQLGTS
mmetsp:Transcript_78505/g.197253  ORF Transcript_78505/g.197253 Transcript_78505/m.197253 type:complete len:204 (-) Transcript_78505:1176-1787(-)